MRKGNYPGREALDISHVVAACLLLIVLLAQSVFATTDINRRDTDYKADQVLKSNASINPSTLALEFSIPIGGYAGRAGFGVPISFNYSSKVWQIYAPPSSSWQEQYGTIITDSSPLYARRSAAGWTSSLGVPRIDFTLGIYEPYRSNVSNYEGQVWEPYIPYGSPPPPENFSIYYVKRLQVTMPDGSSHEFRKDDTIHDYGTAQAPGGSGLPDLAGTFLSVDGTGMRLEVGSQASTLYLPDGSRYLFVQGSDQASAFVDRHGNKMTFDLSTRQWTDTMGRVIEDPIPFNWDPFEQNQTVGDHTEEFPGKGSDTYDVTFSWRYLKDPQGGESGLENTSLDLRYPSDKYCQGNLEYNLNGPYLFDNPEISLVRVCGGYASTAPRFNPIVLTKITFPNDQKYEFRYNVYGEISKIIYPSGGYERFAHDLVPLLQGSMASYDQANRGVVERWVSPSGDGSDEAHWTYIDPVTGALVTTAPDGTKTRQYIHTEASGEPQPYGFGNAKTGRPYEEQVFSSSGQLLRRKLTKYTWTGPLSGGYAGATRDLRPEKEITIIFEPGESNALATMTETVYDTNGSSDPAYFSSLNPKQQKTYSYVVVSVSSAGAADADTAAAWFSSSDIATITEMDYLYDANYKARNITGLVTETRVKDASGNVKAKTQISYDGLSLLDETESTRWEDPNTNYRGLVTSTKSYYDITAGQYVETKAQYDLMGNLRYSWDGRNNLSEIEYSSTYDFAYPTRTITPVPDPNGTYGSNTALETTTTYDFNTGLPLTVTDPNGAVTEMEYNDALLRPTKVIAANDAETITEYGAGTSALTRWVKAKTQIDATNWKEAYTYFDGLGRTIRTQSVDDDGDIFTLTCYDNMGRVSKVTNPFRGYTNQDCSTTSGLEWTTNTFDSAGRPWKVTTPDNAVVETTYGLATSGSQIGTVVTVEDQADKLRRSITNALGQLIRVDEPNASNQLGSIASPNQPTRYSYNTLGKMVHVEQGVQHRYFMYDSLGRLLRVRQPEQEVNTALNTSGDPDNNSWTIGFTHDNNGNILTSRDANNVVITSTFDALNRQLTRSYSDSTPAVTFMYDDTQVAFSKGKLTKVSSSVSEMRYTAYNAVGQLTASTQATDGLTYSSSYKYNLAGMLVEQTYPSGRVVQNILDSNGDISIIRSRKNENFGYWNYAQSFEYTPSGVIKHLRLGNGLWESAVMNSRNQVLELRMGNSPTDASLMHLTYDYGEFDQYANVDATKNAGNIVRQTINFSGLANPFVQNYKYDSLDRITEAKELVNGSQTWIQNFGYDRYGNRTSHSETVLGQSKPINETTLPSIDAYTNRFSITTTYEFDAVGNLIRDAQGRQFTFNGDNKQVEVKDDQNVTVGEYVYDGLGKRIKKITASGTIVFVYDGFGKLIAEYSTAGPPQNPRVNYTATDPLGSPRVLTNENGQIISRRDFMPFGEEIQADLTYRTSNLKYGVGDNVRQKFTGYERDDETGLDFAEARYYFNGHGRFTAVDPLLASGKSANPQTFNRYIYTMNRPLVLADSTGLQAGKRPKTAENEHLEINTSINENAPKILAVKPIPIDKDSYGTAVPIGGKFSIRVTALINKPPEGSNPGDYIKLQSVDYGIPGKETKVVRRTPGPAEDGGTFATAENVEKVNESVTTTGAANEAVIVTKTETFVVKERRNMEPGTGSIGYSVVVIDPVVDPAKPGDKTPDGKKRTPNPAVWSTRDHEDKRIDIRKEGRRRLEED